MDPLDDVFRAVRLNGAFFYHVEAAAPWSVSARAARELAPRILPDAEHLISYHVLLTGECVGGLVDEPPVRMRAGDVIVFPQGEAHSMSSLRPPPNGVAASVQPARFPETQRLGPDGDRDTAFVCGFLGCDARPFNPLITALPRMLHMPAVTEGWLAQFPAQVVEESRRGRTGSESMLTRMAELMFVEVVRRYVESIPGDRIGWLAALRDPLVGSVLRQIHGHPARAWTVATLAREVASSRTVLAERFTALVGVPPMLYLTRWRMQRAAEELQRDTAKVASVAAEVGYDSEAAFSRAFKRATGMSPSSWRRARREARTSGGLAGAGVPGPTGATQP